MSSEREGSRVFLFFILVLSLVMVFFFLFYYLLFFFFNDVLTWKIMEVSKVSIIYIYIYIDNRSNIALNTVSSIKYYFSYINPK